MTSRIITDVTSLRKPSAPVKTLREGLEIARKLTNALAHHNKHAERVWQRQAGKGEALLQGIGLSAVQIGIHRQVCLISYAGKPTILINPVIVAHSADTINFKERCLSMPGVEVETERFLWTMVECINHREPVCFGTMGLEQPTRRSLLMSIVAQHEVSHLYGFLMTDFEKGKPAPPVSEWGVANA